MNDFDLSNLHSISHNSSILDNISNDDLNPQSNLDEKSFRPSLSDLYEEEIKFIDNLKIKEINIKHIKKKNIFKIEPIKRKRGRQLSKKNKKDHTSSDFDNVLCKIQTHFLNFSVSLINDCINLFLHGGGSDERGYDGR